jgi:hypothetical protein
MMVYKYGTLPSSQIHEEKARLQGAIFKLLPYKEEQYEFLDAYFVSLQQRIDGLNHLFGGQAKILTLMSILEAARYETDYKEYRKAIFDACSLVEEIEEGDSNV